MNHEKWFCRACNREVSEDEIDFSNPIMDNDYPHMHKICRGEVGFMLPEEKTYLVATLNDKPKTHALFSPWPIGAKAGLITWCGDSPQNNFLSTHYIASVPEDVTCPACIAGMKKTERSLSQWINRLPTPEDIEGEKP